MDQQQQAEQMTHLVLAMMPMFLLFGIAIMAFFIFLFWRILSKAGLAGPLALLTLLPVVGPLVVLCILAFSDWRVMPIPPAAYYPPTYPPAPTYPPTTPPSQ